MNNELETIDLASLDTVSGGGKAQLIKKGASWLWRNVVAPIGGGALYDWATGGNKQQPPQQPPQGQ